VRWKLCHADASRLLWPRRVVDDLHELQAFLAQRATELGSGAGEALSASLPQAVQARLPAVACFVLQTLLLATRRMSAPV
jgi:CDK5 regulatory subunit-associated protein 3